MTSRLRPILITVAVLLAFVLFLVGLITALRRCTLFTMGGDPFGAEVARVSLTPGQSRELPLALSGGTLLRIGVGYSASFDGRFDGSVRLVLLRAGQVVAEQYCAEIFGHVGRKGRRGTTTNGKVFAGCTIRVPAGGSDALRAKADVSGNLSLQRFAVILWRK